MFTKITRINGCGEEKESIINTDMIIGITEKHLEQENLYNESGDLVETRTPDKTFEIVLKGGLHTIVSEKTYKELVKLLIK